MCIGTIIISSVVWRRVIFLMFIINWNKVGETVKGERFQKILHR